MLENLYLPNPDGLQVALTVCTLLVIWFGWAKVLGPKVMRTWNRFLGIVQTIAGRDPIIDKRTGEEIAPAVPAIGHQLASIDNRFAVVNENMAELIAVVKSNQDAHHRIDAIEARVDDHDRQFIAFGLASQERTAIHTEAAAMFDMVAKRDSDVIDSTATEETPK